MASEKIQKLTSVLYQEGIEKGEKKASEIVEAAKKRADEIVEKAKADAGAIIREAEEKAKALKTHVETETRIAAREIIHEFHHKVIEMILTRVVDEKTEQAFGDRDNITKWITAVAENWKPGQKSEPLIEILLPEARRKEFDEWARSESVRVLRSSVEIKFSDTIKEGFRIVPEKGSFRIDFSPESFEELFRHYLKARTRKLLFGE